MAYALELVLDWPLACGDTCCPRWSSSPWCCTASPSSPAATRPGPSRCGWCCCCGPSHGSRWPSPISTCSSRGLSGLTSGRQRLRVADVRRRPLRWPSRSCCRSASRWTTCASCLRAPRPTAGAGGAQCRGGSGLDLAGHAQDAGRGFSGFRRAAVRHIAAARGRTHADATWWATCARWKATPRLRCCSRCCSLVISQVKINVTNAVLPDHWHGATSSRGSRAATRAGWSGWCSTSSSPCCS